MSDNSIGHAPDTKNDASTSSGIDFFIFESYITDCEFSVRFE